MSEQNPYEQLGVTENSSFEEIQAAKNDFTIATVMTVPF